MGINYLIEAFLSLSQSSGLETFLIKPFFSFVTFIFFALFIIQALSTIQESSFSLFAMVGWVRIISEHGFKGRNQIKVFR